MTPAGSEEEAGAAAAAAGAAGAGEAAAEALDAAGGGGGPDGGGPQSAAEAMTSFSRLASYLKPYGWLLAASLLSMTLAAAFDAFSLSLLIPFLRSLFGEGQVLLPETGTLVERVIDWAVGPFIGDASGLDALMEICLIVLGALFLKNLFLYLGKLASMFVQERVERDMRDEVYAHLQRLPLEFFGETKAGQLIARVLTDTRETKRIISFALVDVVRRATEAVAFLAFMMALSWRLTLMSLVLAPLLVAVLRPLIRRLRKGFRVAYDRQGELLSILQETVSGIRLVKAYGAEDYEQGRFEDSSDQYADDIIRTQALRELSSPLSEVLSATVAVALLYVGAQIVLGAGFLGPESFLTFLMYALRLISPVKRLAEFPARAQSALAAADRFFEIVDAPPEPVGREGTVVLDGFREEIRFEDVWFSYEEGKPVLKGIDLEVDRGTVVALVGPSGAGKSTLVDLLPRFIEPDRGRIVLDGRDIRDLTLASLRGQMGVVSQQTVIFNDTVRANVAYGAPERYSEEQVRRAIEAAHAAEFVDELPAGLATPLGDRGVRLSGGQRQRIGIARAILRDPPILILDEATSDLDTESEQLIQRALDHLLEGRTVFVIAHRLSTVQGADRILVLEAGEIVDRGTHDELYARDGLYRRLYDMQFEVGGAGPSRPAGAGVAEAGEGEPG